MVFLPWGRWYLYRGAGGISIMGRGRTFIVALGGISIGIVGGIFIMECMVL